VKAAIAAVRTVAFWKLLLCWRCADRGCGRRPAQARVSTPSSDDGPAPHRVENAPAPVPPIDAAIVSRSLRIDAATRRTRT